MDKKKLQDFIQKLQEMATQLNDIDESAEDSSLEDSDVHQTISAQSVNTTTSSSNSDFITIKRSDGTQIGYTENFTLNGGAYITV